MAFVRFVETGKSFTSRASISSRGMISFNDGARRKFQMDEYDFCVLYFDKDAMQVGVELTKDKGIDGAIKLRKRKTGADIGAKSFLHYFDIMPDETTMYKIRAGDVSNMIIIDIKTGRKRKNKQGI